MITASSADQAYNRAAVLYHEVKHLVYASSDVGDGQIDGKLNELQQWISKADELHYKEPQQRRYEIKKKIDQLSFDFQDVKRSRDERNKQYRQQIAQERRRELLLGKKFTAHSGDAYIDMLGADLEHQDRLSQAGRAMSDIIGHGAAIKEALVSQREMIKGTKRRMIDIAHTLGLSNTVMRLIEQRTMQDKVVLFGGMGITLLLMYFIYTSLG